jgi:RNA polymerase sigma factor for flagellar operon FliA
MYTATGKVDTNTYIQRYGPLVKRIAHHMMVRLPASVDVADIIQAGMIGLLDAVRRYQVSQGAEFETYAIQRIRGAMLDELRQNDWLPRGLRRDMRRIEAAISALEQKNGRQPTERELADALAMPLAEYQQTLQEARGYQIVYFEDFSEGDDEHFLDRHVTDGLPTPLEFLEDERVRAALIEAIDDLPEREKLVMGLYYEQELNLREIGEVMGVSESRVCQLHSQAVARLRAKLKPWAPENAPTTRSKAKKATARAD